MADIRIEKLADLLVNYSVSVKQGDRVMIQGDTAGEPLLKAVYAKVLQAGGHPLQMTTLSGSDELLFRYASEEQLKHVPEPIKLAYSTYDVRIFILADPNTKALSNVDPARIVTRAQARRDLMQIFLKRAAAGELRWVLAPYPTNAFAQDAEMGLAEYEDFVYSACMPDMNDPIGYWRKFAAWQMKVVEWLKGKDKVHIKGKDTDLRLSIAGRTFESCHGERNMPDGEVFTGPVEDSIEGHVTFSYPAIYQGREVTGVRLWFEKGKVVKATAEKNEEFLLKTLDTDAGSRNVGEFAIGTNEGITKFTREILFDEKIGGTIHMALGSGYPETGSKNESAIHWDMVCDLRDGGEIWVDDTLLHKNGKLAVNF
ncbi:MAG: aminopeptidase [Dehalococcoidia bacterium]|nr:aminopeptidase [Dehalococcoidia bacterium]